MGEIEIKSLQYGELEDYFISAGEGRFRAAQVFSWLHKGAESYDEMTNLSKPLRQRLKESFIITVPVMENKQVSRDGTVKYLWRLRDGECVESVVMSYKHGLSICLSTQCGCRMGCAFCASTMSGLKRSLTAGEILDQVIFASKDVGRISNIVLMGVGEPLDNYDNVLAFLRNVGHPAGINIGYRHISLSTSGLVPRIYDLAKEGLPITLSVSLHAPNDEIRNKLMPINRKYNIGLLLEACRGYISRTGRRISFEYAMVDGINDTAACADELGERLRGMLCHVNLIPVNPVEGRKFRRSSPQRVAAFQKRLEQHGINVTVRRELGADIDGACGQLRARALRLQ